MLTLTMIDCVADHQLNFKLGLPKNAHLHHPEFVVFPYNFNQDQAHLEQLGSPAAAPVMMTPALLLM